MNERQTLPFWGIPSVEWFDFGIRTHDITLRQIKTPSRRGSRETFRATLSHSMARASWAEIVASGKNGSVTAGHFVFQADEISEDMPTMMSTFQARALSFLPR